MPSRNSRKTYVENYSYHIYNRGVEKRTIFLDDQDYGVFLSYLKEYLMPKDEKNLFKALEDTSLTCKEKEKLLRALRLNNFNSDISLMAYCLMPNHFHFLIRQKSPGTIDKFMNSLASRYTTYFNRKYHRVGSLYQDVYKAVAINDDAQLLHLSRYIHKQALALGNQPSSFSEYLGQRKTEWIYPEEILSHFSKTNPSLSYNNFMSEWDNPEILLNLTLDEV